MSARGSTPPCRSCGSDELEVFLSLGRTPLADALIDPSSTNGAELRFPLEVAFCPRCTLVQILEEVSPEALFVDNYLYFSSFSDHLLDHSRAHAHGLIASRNLGPDDLVVEIASNDGYLLRHVAEQGVQVLGIEPAPAQADAAEEAGIPTLRSFFGLEFAHQLRGEGVRPKVIVANNVMAHVPDLNGFVAGMSVLLAEGGLITIENPWVRDLVRHCEFDTIYHEHFCYFSCHAVDALMRRHGLFLNHVEYFPDLHGGTLRWHVGDRDEPSDEVRARLAQEQEEGVTSIEHYRGFGTRVEQVRAQLRELLERLRDEGASVAGYGAAAKGATLLNYAGIGTDLLPFVVDRNTHKQGLLMPGTHQPIRSPDVLLEDRPDYLLLLAWNFADEIQRQQAAYRDQGGRFIVPVPTPAVIG